MKLYILRHADADTPAENDDDRAISKKGIKQCKRIVEFCTRLNLKPDALLASPLPRAQQTAKPLAKKLGVKPETVPWLIYETETGKVLEQLALRTDLASIMLVGHNPDLSMLAATLLGSENGSIRVRKGSLMLLDVAEFSKGGATLEWSIPAQLL